GVPTSIMPTTPPAAPTTSGPNPDETGVGGGMSITSPERVPMSPLLDVATSPAPDCVTTASSSLWPNRERPVTPLRPPPRYVYMLRLPWPSVARDCTS